MNDPIALEIEYLQKQMDSLAVQVKRLALAIEAINKQSIQIPVYTPESLPRANRAKAD